ncbi:MAG: SpoIID/LytB domain-containing protein, partial [Candidatus Cloacimonetes bacterium]|nr:SpoIID/LytB domain-containing protein [Candidatus Cloacimonadota bacterium]
MRIRILIALAWLMTGWLTAAQFIDGVLYLEVNLAAGNTLNLRNGGHLTFAELDSPVSNGISGDLAITVAQKDVQQFWGIINRIEPVAREVDIDPDSDVIRRTLFWHNGKLLIRLERLVFEDVSFPALEEAKRYASQTGTPEVNICLIPLNHPRIRVTNRSGKEQYYELPVRLSSDKALNINDQNEGYAGDLIIRFADNRLIINHYLSLEDYVAGVIQHEIGGGAPLEALKVQSVATRTHAISMLLYNRHRDDGFDLCNTTHCQVYKGVYLQNANVLEAVKATRNIVMNHGNRVADAVYHSICGGKTDVSNVIWRGSPVDYLQGVTCMEEAEDYDLNSEAGVRQWINLRLEPPGMASWEKKNMNWSRSVSRRALQQNSGVSNITSIVINRRGVSGRIVSLTINGSSSKTYISEWQIRQTFGNLPSSLFYIVGNFTSNGNGAVVIRPGTYITMRGRGYGHGVGMCQVGTLNKAREGWLWEDILHFYYPGVELTDHWNMPDLPLPGMPGQSDPAGDLDGGLLPPGIFIGDSMIRDMT